MYSFHPREIALCGPSGSGKTTLACKLIERLSTQYTVGYAKHSDCAFDVDTPGKDTHRAHAAGAAAVAIYGSERFATYGNTEMDFVTQRTLLSNTDFVVAEGWKDGPIPRLVFVDNDTQAKSITADATRRSGEILGWITPDASILIDAPQPAFCRDEVQAIAMFMSSRFESSVNAPALYGLVLAGGQSSRMKTDKASLTYGDQPQLNNAFAQLNAVCDQTFVSSRKEQWADGRFSEHPIIEDRYQGLGPMAGMLSAMTTHPTAAWLVLACDLPFIDPTTLTELIAQRDRFKQATAYISSSDGLPEPLCAIYEPTSLARLWQFVSLGYTCPRKLLINSHVKLLTLSNARALDNVNHPEEYTAAAAEIAASAP